MGQPAESQDADLIPGRAEQVQPDFAGHAVQARVDRPDLARQGPLRPQLRPQVGLIGVQQRGQRPAVTRIGHAGLPASAAPSSGRPAARQQGRPRSAAPAAAHGTRFRSRPEPPHHARATTTLTQDVPSRPIAGVPASAGSQASLIMPLVSAASRTVTGVGVAGQAIRRRCPAVTEDLMALQVRVPDPQDLAG